ncbi:hypothetical protein E2C01_062444 [Portunus trituberculatus]|uniref:Uncharacterized protein n=1 Tax=Portunus trituberculatus TaxID=210409 RepID=A0A5B7HE26_PORTR|nr:hypothetical protein [Portunus trituberculatus]
MNTGYSFNSYIRGWCVVENVDILRGPPIRVKVSVRDPNDTCMFCCCLPREPQFTKVAGFRFDYHKHEATLKKYTSLESVMFMDGMAFLEYWAPRERAVKVSLMQRRGKNLDLMKIKINARNSVTTDYKPELDFKVLASQPPPPGPERVKWVREVAAIKARQRSHKHTPKRTGAPSLVHGSDAAKH